MTKFYSTTVSQIVQDVQDVRNNCELTETPFTAKEVAYTLGVTVKHAGRIMQLWEGQA